MRLAIASAEVDTLSPQQQTAIFFSLFTKELLSDMEYRFKINLDADRNSNEVIDKMKSCLNNFDTEKVVLHQTTPAKGSKAVPL